MTSHGRAKRGRHASTLCAENRSRLHEQYSDRRAEMRLKKRRKDEMCFRRISMW